MNSEDLVDMLRGGDLRSIGRSNEVVAQLLDDPQAFDQLIEAMVHEDPVVRARAADAAEKVTARCPELLVPYQPRLLGDLAGRGPPAAGAADRERHGGDASPWPQVAGAARSRRDV